MSEKYDTPTMPQQEEKEPEVIEYQIGKRVFVVTPVYREDSGKTIYDAIRNLIKNDSKNH